ncbi:MAG TPA: peptidoglycan glycosyltransferase [Bacteroidales bacterium]|nr:peptidoglycan glycosyltransferase [Bacteroidales bacterium]
MRKKNKRLLIKILTYSGITLFSFALFALLFFFMVYVGAFGPLPDKEELVAINNEEATLVFSSDNILLGKYFAENRTNIRLDEIPDHLINALISTEDKRFFTHKGYDIKSYFRVFLRSILLGDKRGGGGSTLTQQLVKNLFGRDDFGFLSLPVNKIKEIVIASRLEQVYGKEELLLLYLNSVPFGEDVYGVESAARRYFNKPARELEIEESAVLVGLLKANTYFNPRLNPKQSLLRRNLVLSLMEKEHYLSAEQVDRLRKLPLKINYENVGLNAPAGYFVHQVKKKTLEILETIKANTAHEYSITKDGLRIYTTLNFKIQEFAENALQKQFAIMQPKLDSELERRHFKKQWLKQHTSKSDANETLKREVEIFDGGEIQTIKMNKLDSLWHYYKMLNAAVLIINPKNGDVLSWIGGNNFKYLPFDMVLSHRQIASAFKPVLYATALENGYTPCTYLENEEKKYPQYDDWEPRNFDHTSSPDSTVAFWYALSNSMNLPTVDLYFKVGRENLQNTCNKLHFPNIWGDEPSIALGTLDLSLEEIVRAYGSFANQGKMNDLVLIEKITDASGNILYHREYSEAEKIFSEETSQTITAILQQVINQGTGTRIRNSYGIQAELAGKTGTAQNYSDAWFIAYTPDIVLGTWVGASTPDIHFNGGNGSGSSLALPILANVIREIEKDAELRNRYLTSFAVSNDTYSFLQCDPYMQKGVKGFFNRLFPVKNKNDKNAVDSDKEKKEDRGVKSFFKNFFKRK